MYNFRSTACISIINNATTTYYAGLSGIDSALAGLLLLFWLVYLEHLSGQRMRHYYGIVLAGILALSTGIIARYIILFHVRHNIALLASLAGCIILIGLIITLYRGQFFEVYRVLAGFSWSTRIVTVTIVAIFAYFVWNLFPEQLANTSRISSIPLHLAGIVIGILAGYLLLVYLEQMAYFNGEKEVISRE